LVVCSGRPELVALAPELPLEEGLVTGVSREPVDRGVSPAGIDMTPLEMNVS
jgi:hypothetical protein